MNGRRPHSPDADFSLRDIAVPAFAPAMMFGFGEGAVIPMIALTAREMGASVSMAALIVALIGVGALISNIPGALLTARFGERWAIVAAGVWSALGILVAALSSDLRLFALGCLMIGMSQAIYTLARQSYLGVAVPLAYRARALATLGGLSRVGMFAGPLLAAWLVHLWGTQAAFALGVVSMLGAAVLGATVPDLVEPPHGSDPGTRRPVTLASTLRDHRRVFVTLGAGVILVASVRAARQVVIPLWSSHVGLAPAAASLVYGVAAGIDMLVFYPAGKLMDLKGRRSVALPSMLIMGTALILMPLTTGFTTLLIVAMVLGFGNGISAGMVMTLGADHAPTHGRAHFLGIWRLAVESGSSLGPALLSLLTGSASLASGIVCIGVLGYAAAAALARWLPSE